MENYFYHETRGLWVTTGNPSPAILSTYPDGYLRIPAPPVEGDWDFSDSFDVTVNEVPIFDEDGNDTGEVEVYNLVKNAWVERPYVDPVIAWRKSAYLAKADFVGACLLAGIIPLDQAAGVARGDWPHLFVAALDNLSDQEKVMAEIQWAATVNVRRNHPLISLLGAYLDMGDADLDSLFGWQG